MKSLVFGQILKQIFLVPYQTDWQKGIADKRFLFRLGATELVFQVKDWNLAKREIILAYFRGLRMNAKWKERPIEISALWSSPFLGYEFTAPQQSGPKNALPNLSRAFSLVLVFVRDLIDTPAVCGLAATS